MKSIAGDIWTLLDEISYSAVLIPTNGCVTKNGEAVMGAGVAKDAKDRYPQIARRLGTFLNYNISHMTDPQWKEPWNVPYCIGTTEKGTRILSFPTKPTWCYTDKENKHVLGRYRKKIEAQKKIPGWQAKSDLFLIERSARLVSELSNDNGFESILLPAVGTGYGELDPDDVIPVLKKYFDDRYTVIVKMNE